MTPPCDVNISELILDEVRSLRDSQTEILQRVTTLETTVREKLQPLYDNGKTGLLTKIQNRLESLEASRTYLLGIAAAVSAVVALVLHFI